MSDFANQFTSLPQKEIARQDPFQGDFWNNLQQESAAHEATRAANVDRYFRGTLIATLPDHDATRYVMPWLWRADSTTGRALTPEGEEFGYELRFSRYKTVQVKP